MIATNDANKKVYEDIIRNEFPKLIEMFERYLDFNRWGFKLTHSGVFPQYLPFIIYQSDQCKLKFTVEYERRNDPPRILMQYGRLHAPVDQQKMIWNGEECRCWHENGKALNFLDGLSPSDVSNDEFNLPRRMREFGEANSRYTLGQEYTIRMNAYIWENYGQRLFDLFDLRRPDLWEKYRSFLKQYYTHRDELKGRPPSTYRPRSYDVC